MGKRQVKEKLCNSQFYYRKTKEAWREDFIEQYHKNKPTSAALYNKKRAAGSPSWVSVAGMFGITKWTDWLHFCDIVPYIAGDGSRYGTNRGMELRLTREFNIPGNPAFSAYLQERFGTHGQGDG